MNLNKCGYGRQVIVCLLALGWAQMGFAANWVNVQTYFPENWQQQDQLDLREYIQQAVNENPRVYFPGSGDADNPLLYHITTGLEIPSHHHVDFAPNHRLVRLPSKGHMVTLKDHARLSGAIIHGNKYKHWPDFEDLGKSDSGVRLHSHTVVEDVVIYNTPGIGFFSYGHYNKVYRCLVENAGYIDVKFGAMFYQGSRDRWSGDGYYFRGTGNLIKDSEAYDTQRWDFCSSHSGARQNTYVDCRGGDVEFHTYGFIDIEGADANNRLIRCISPNSHIAIPGSHRTEVIQCMATHISLYDHQNAKTVDMYGGGSQGVYLDGNITTRGGIVFGGWSSRRNQHVPGGASPIIVNNRMYKMHAGPTDQYSDWSFSVHAVDGQGVVANNLLFEFDDGYTKGPGMHIEGVEGQNNQVVYGQWKLDLPEPAMRYGYYDEEHIRQRAVARAQEALQEYVAVNHEDQTLHQIHWLPLTARFIQDHDDQGQADGWFSQIPEDQKGLMQLSVTEHWDFTIGTYYGVGWYYLTFPWPDGLETSDLFLYAGGIDTYGQLYLNGQLVGQHSQWDKPSLHSLNEQVVGSGKQLLAIRVSTPPSGLAGVYAPLALVVMK